MKNLLVLVELISESRFKVKKTLDLVVEPDTQMRRLYDAIVAGKIYCSNTLQGPDAKCAGCYQREACDARVFKAVPEFNGSEGIYATMKSKLKDRLDDALLLIDSNTSGTNDRQAVYMSCLKKQSVIISLLSKGHREIAYQKLEQLYRVSSQFEFTEITIHAVQMMRLLVCTFYGDGVQYNKYSTILTASELLRTREDMAEHYYTHLISSFVNQKTGKKEMAALAEQYFREISPWLSESPSYRFQLFARLLELSVHDNNGNYAEVIRLCQESIDFFEEKPYKSTNALQVFYYTLLMSCLYMRSYDIGREAANKYQDFFSTGSFNWFKWQELCFLIEIYDAKYEAARNIWSYVIQSAAFATLPPNMQELWRIFEAYLYFLEKCNYLRPLKTENKFSILRTMNDIQVSVRDKSGMNIPVLVIQYLLPLAEGDIARCVDRQEALAKYRTRYLLVENATRSHYFFKMLELIPKTKFNISELRKKSEPLFQQLKNSPIESVDQNFEVEVIPYEQLWALVLRLVERNSVTDTKESSLSRKKALSA